MCVSGPRSANIVSNILVACCGFPPPAESQSKCRKQLGPASRKQGPMRWREAAPRASVWHGLFAPPCPALPGWEEAACFFTGKLRILMDVLTRYSFSPKGLGCLWTKLPRRR